MKTCTRCNEPNEFGYKQKVCNRCLEITEVCSSCDARKLIGEKCKCKKIVCKGCRIITGDYPPKSSFCTECFTARTQCKKCKSRVLDAWNGTCEKCLVERRCWVCDTLKKKFPPSQKVCVECFDSTDVCNKCRKRYITLEGCPNCVTKKDIRECKVCNQERNHGYHKRVCEWCDENAITCTGCRKMKTPDQITGKRCKECYVPPEPKKPKTIFGIIKRWLLYYYDITPEEINTVKTSISKTINVEKIFKILDTQGYEPDDELRKALEDNKKPVNIPIPLNKQKCTGCSCWRELEDFIRPGSRSNRCNRCYEKDRDRIVTEQRAAAMKVAAYYKAYRIRQRQKDEDAFLERSAKNAREYHEKNKEHLNKKARLSTTERIKVLKESAEKRHIEWNLSDQQAKKYLTEKCYYCDYISDDHLNGIDRLDSSKSYSIKNTVPSCKWCNKMKNTIDPVTFLKRVKHILGIQSHPDMWPECKPSTFSNYRHRALKKNLEFNLTKEEFEYLCLKKCIYCSRDSTQQNKSGIDRINSNLGYFKENCQPCCSECNYMKGTLSHDHFIECLKRIAKKNVNINYGGLDVKKTITRKSHNSILKNKVNIYCKKYNIQNNIADYNLFNLECKCGLKVTNIIRIDLNGIYDQSNCKGVCDGCSQASDIRDISENVIPYRKYKYKYHGLDLTKDQYTEMCTKKCRWCESISNGIDLIDNNDPPSLDNCFPCCLRCKKLRHTSSIDQFRERLRCLAV